MVVGGLVQGLLEDVGWVVGDVVDVLQLTQSLSLFKNIIGGQVIQIDPHHADKNLQADVFNGGGHSASE